VQIKYRVLLLFMILAFALTANTNAASSQCDYSIGASHMNYTVNGTGCKSLSLTLANGISGDNITCINANFNSNSTITLDGSNAHNYLFDCNFSGGSILLYNRASLFIISPNSTEFVPDFIGKNSNITVGYYLRMNVLEPPKKYYYYNSTSVFLNRVAAFGYIIPLMQNTIKLNNSQLQYQPSFAPQTISLIDHLRTIVPFGVYGQNSSQFYANVTYLPYGTLEGYKTFVVPDYTLEQNRTIDYNPYAVDYSFFAFDQLIMFTVNITKNLNITPLYIQPLYPTFNYNIIPDNGRKNFTIRWLLTVPPQDHNWNFSFNIYRYYADQELTMNPLGNNSIAPSTLKTLLTYPSKNYSFEINGTQFFYLNLSTTLQPGLNSSIIIANGTAPGIGSYIQDSTTPSFSFGLAMCSSPYNLNETHFVVTKSGYYTMSKQLLPLYTDLRPLRVYAPCYVGAVIQGTNITINCDNGTINDIANGIIVANSSNIKIMNCNIYGNGFRINSSRNVTILNSTIIHTSNSSSYASYIYGSDNILFSSTSISKGFAGLYAENNSYNISVMKLFNNITTTVATTNATTPTTAASHRPKFLSMGLQDALLYLLAAATVVAYIYIFLKIQYKKGRKPTKAKNRKKA